MEKILIEMEKSKSSISIQKLGNNYIAWTNSESHINLSLFSKFKTFWYSFRNKVYVIGGDYDMSCEVLDLKENKWSFISSYSPLLPNSLYSFSSSIISEWILWRNELWYILIIF